MDRIGTEIQTAYERLERTFERVAHRISQLQSERDALRSEIEGLRGSEKHAIDSHGELQAILASQTTHVEELESEIERLHSELTQRDVALTSGQVALRQLEEDSRLLIGEKEELTRTLDEYRHIAAERDDLLNEIASLKRRIEEMEGEGRDQNAAMESRVTTAERERTEMSQKVLELERERDQARATVESMLVRVRQLEANDEDVRSSSRRKVEELNADLQEALNMASAKEDECQALLQRMAEYEAASRNGSDAEMSDEQRVVIIEAIESALSLVDKHIDSVEAA